MKSHQIGHVPQLPPTQSQASSQMRKLKPREEQQRPLDHTAYWSRVRPRIRGPMGKAWALSKMHMAICCPLNRSVRAKHPPPKEKQQADRAQHQVPKECWELCDHPTPPCPDSKGPKPCPKGSGWHPSNQALFSSLDGRLTSSATVSWWAWEEEGA